MPRSLVQSPPAASLAPPQAAPEVIPPPGYAPPSPPPPYAVPCADAAPTPFTPFMLGDFVGPVANLFTDVKIAEGESPRPIDRVFFKFNYYNNVNKPQWADPTEPIHNVSLYRYVFGFEKTFFDQRVSLGLRVPFGTLDAPGKDFHLAPDPTTGTLAAVAGGPGFDSTQFGNISAIVKAILWENRQRGDLVSAGATLSFPTASSQKIDPGQSTLLYVQPFGGFIFNRGNIFFQGFSSVTLPVARPESIVLFTDLGVGYYAYQADPTTSRLTAIAPTIEFHMANPLRQADPTVLDFNMFDTLKLHNVIDFTLGTTFVFANRATLGTGLAFPVTGPKPFDIEVITQLNYRF